MLTVERRVEMLLVYTYNTKTTLNKKRNHVPYSLAYALFM